MREQDLPDIPGIMQSSRIRSGSTLLFVIHFKASAPEVSQCSCSTQPKCQLVPQYTHTHPPQPVSLWTNAHTHIHM